MELKFDNHFKESEETDLISSTPDILLGQLPLNLPKAGDGQCHHWKFLSQLCKLAKFLHCAEYETQFRQSPKVPYVTLTNINGYITLTSVTVLMLLFPSHSLLFQP